MAAAQHAVEQACAQLQDPHTHAAAAEMLLAFRNSPEALPACKHILEHSRMDMARFQAAITLREAALREWPLMSPTDRQALRSHVLQLIARCCTCVYSSYFRAWCMHWVWSCLGLVASACAFEHHATSSSGCI